MYMYMYMYIYKKWFCICIYVCLQHVYGDTDSHNPVGVHFFCMFMCGFMSLVSMVTRIRGPGGGGSNNVMSVAWSRAASCLWCVWSRVSCCKFLFHVIYLLGYHVVSSSSMLYTYLVYHVVSSCSMVYTYLVYHVVSSCSMLYTYLGITL